MPVPHSSPWLRFQSPLIGRVESWRAAGSSLWQKSGFGIDTTDPMYYTRTYGDGYDP